MKKRSILFIMCIVVAIMTASGEVRKDTAASAEPQNGQGAVMALPSTWTTPVNASLIGAWSNDPYLAVDSKSKCYVSWVGWYGGVGARRDMMANTNKSGAWGTPRSNELAYTMIDDVGFPEITVTPSGSSAIYVWMDGNFSMARMVVMGDELANGSWTGAGIISTGVSEPSTYPSVSASPVDNTICFVWQQDMNPGFQLASQYRDGATGKMSGTELVYSAQTTQYWPNVFVDAKGTAHLVWITRVGVAVVWYSKNTNIKNLTGWSAPLALSGGTSLDWTQAIVKADDNGNAYVVWSDNSNGAQDILLRYQVNGAWQSTMNISNTAAPSEYPSIAVNPANGEMYISWTELVGSGAGNVFLKTYEIDKTTGQKAWSSAIQVTTSGAAEQSSIAATKDPDIHLVYSENGKIWYTSRLAPRLTAIAAPTVTTKVNRVLFSSQKTITVNFAKNTANDDATLSGYRLYAKKSTEDDSAYAVVATFGVSDALQYIMKKIPVGTKYSFIASVINKDGLELKTAAVVSD